MHDRASFEVIESICRYRRAREVKVGRAYNFDEAIVLFWKNADHDFSLSRRPVLFNVVVANICGLPELSLYGFKDAIDDRRLIALPLSPVLLPLGNDRIVTRHVNLNRDSDRLLAAIGTAVGYFHNDTCAGDVGMETI